MLTPLPQILWLLAPSHIALPAPSLAQELPPPRSPPGLLCAPCFSWYTAAQAPRPITSPQGSPLSSQLGPPRGGDRVE